MSHSRMASIDYPLFPSLFPADYRNYAVEEWLQELEAVGFGTANIDVSVQSITQMKLNDHQGHEKSVIKLRVIPRLRSSDPFDTYITTERGADLDNDGGGSCSSFFSPDDKECDSCALHQLVSSDLDAIDRVTIPARSSRLTFDEYILKRQKNYIILCCITLSSPMTLSQLAVLLTTIRNISTKYDPLKCNCYWYNYTLGEVIVREFGGLVSKDAHLTKRGKFLRTNFMNVNSVEEVRQNFRQACADMENRLVSRRSMQRAAITETVQLQQQLATERTEREQAEREREQAEREWRQQLEAERTKREQLERDRELAMEQVSRLQALLAAAQLSDPSLPKVP